MKDVFVVGAAIVDGARVLACRRGPTMSGAGQWELPGGKIESDETPEDALARELDEELAIGVEVGRYLGRGTAELGERRIVLDVYIARIASGTLTLREHDEVRWLTAAELEDVEWAQADRPVLTAVRAALRATA